MSSPADGAAAFRAALLDAADLLAALPRRREDVAQAREHVAALGAAHPTVRISVAVDLEPGSERADYDLLLAHPDGGTLAVAYAPERGNPWFVDYGEHWAANHVLTVGTDAPVTVQQALTALEVRAAESPELVDGLVEDVLIAREMGGTPAEVSQAELQAAVDAFRAARGLHSAAATRAWLTRMGWSVELFQSLIENGVRIRKTRERLAADQVAPYFEAHADDFAIVRLVRVEAASPDVARRLAALGAEQGLLRAAELVAGNPAAGRVEATLTTVRAHELPPELAVALADLTAAPSPVLGPVAGRGRWWVAQLLARHPASLDEATRAAVTRVLVRRWLDGQREALGVRWHWL